MVYENAGQLLAYCFCKKYCCHLGVYAAGKGTKHLAVSYLFADLGDGGFHKGIHAPVTLAVTYVIYKVGKHLHTLLCVHDFRMELHRIQLLFRVFHGSYGTHGSVGGDSEI